MEFVLVGVTETLNTDLSHGISKKMESEGGDIRHYDTGSDNFNGLPLEVQVAVKAINDLNVYAFVKGLGYVRHVIGTVTFADEVELKKAGFGFTASIYGYPTKIYGNWLQNQWTYFANRGFYIAKSTSKSVASDLSKAVSDEIHYFRYGKLE